MGRAKSLFDGIKQAAPVVKSRVAQVTAAIAAAITAEEAEAGRIDPILEAMRLGGKALIRHFDGEKAVVRGEREVAESVTLSKAEKAAIRAAVDKSGMGTYKAAEASARKMKARFPSRDVDTPWNKIEINGMDIGMDRAGKKVLYKPKTGTTPYQFHIDPSTGKEATRQSQHYHNMVDGIANEIIATAKAAQNGDPAAIKIMENAGWYKNVEARGFNEYGSFYDEFGDLLGATSPNTPVQTNFNFSQDLLTKFSRGDFDKQVDDFADIMDEVDRLEGALKVQNDLSRYVGAPQADLNKSARTLQTKARIKELKGQINQVRQDSGKLYGMNSTRAMEAFADRWRIFRKGGAPKAKNFSGNLVGYSIKPTIDVWSARNLRRHAGLPPIPSPAETGVTGEIIDPKNFTNSLEFGFGQDVLTDATKQVNDVLGTNLEPRDMQALQWFVEKDEW